VFCLKVCRVRNWEGLRAKRVLIVKDLENGGTEVRDSSVREGRGIGRAGGSDGEMQWNGSRRELVR